MNTGADIYMIKNTVLVSIYIEKNDTLSPSFFKSLYLLKE